MYVLEIGANQREHDSSLRVIQKATSDDLIIFLGHGGSDYWQGAAEYNYDGSVSNGIEKYIDKSNIEVLADKKIISFSCNSTEKLGELAIENGAITFWGFGDIPTDYNSIFFEDKPFERGRARFKGELINSLKLSIFRGIQDHLTFEQTFLYFKLRINKSHSDLILNHKGFKGNRKVGELLFSVKNEMKLFGDKKALLLI